MIKDDEIDPVLIFSYGGSPLLPPPLYLKLYSIGMNDVLKAKPHVIKFALCNDVPKAVGED